MCLFDYGFAGERALINGKRHTIDENTVGRHLIAGG